MSNLGVTSRQPGAGGWASCLPDPLVCLSRVQDRQACAEPETPAQCRQLKLIWILRHQVPARRMPSAFIQNAHLPSSSALSSVLPCPRGYCSSLSVLAVIWR